MITKLTIWPCDIAQDTGTATAKSTGQFEVMLNPAGYKLDYAISYSETAAHDKPQGRPLGAPAAQPKFKSNDPQKVDFDFVIDGTGVVPVYDLAPGVPGKARDDVQTQVTNLKALVHDFVGTNHEPNVVKLVWGQFSFIGRLTNMSVDYTLFKPNGDPLRAKIHLAFISYKGPAEAATAANLTSPDLTHLVEVKAGDSLPLLCYRIYKDSSYYLEVAKANGITNFRNIAPGTRLNFPPLR